MLTSCQSEDEYSHIAEHTAGVIFLGSPLKGTSLARWGDLVAIVGDGFGYNSNGNLVHELDEGNQSITELLNDFIRWVGKKQVSVCCFYELYTTDYRKRLGRLGSWMPSTFTLMVRPVFGLGHHSC